MTWDVLCVRLVFCGVIIASRSLATPSSRDVYAYISLLFFSLSLSSNILHKTARNRDYVVDTLSSQFRYAHWEKKSK